MTTIFIMSSDFRQTLKHNLNQQTLKERLVEEGFGNKMEYSIELKTEMEMEIKKNRKKKL